MNFIINCFVLMLSKKVKLPCPLFCLYKLIVLFDWTLDHLKVFFFFFLTIFFTRMCYNSNLMYTLSPFLLFTISMLCMCYTQFSLLNLLWKKLFDLISIQFIFHFYNYSIIVVKCHSVWVFSPINLHVRVCCGLSYIV